MSKIRHLFTAATLAVCALLPTVAMAQNVLVLATDTASEASSDQYWASIKNIITAFRASGATVTPSHTNVEDAARAAKVLTSGDITADGYFSGYDIVVVATGQRPIREDPPGPGAVNNLAALKKQITENSKPSFIILSDGCNSCVNGSNDALGKFIGIVNDATGMNASYEINKSIYTGTNEAQLTGSMYSSYFAATPSLPSIKADYYGAIRDANDYNKIYGTDSSGALAIFVPQKQMKGGKGACTFMAGDLSIFKNGFSSQHDKVAKTLIKNVQPSSAACNRAPASQPPNVLFLSTKEETSGPNQGDYFIKNAYDAFNAAAIAAGGGIKDKRYALTSSSGVTFDKTDFDNVNVVVVATKHGVMDSTLYATVETMMQTRPDLSFIILTDSCASCAPRGDATNPFLFEASLRQALSWDKLTLNHVRDSNYSAQPLNPASPWASAFKGTNPGSDVIRSHVYGVMECLPARNKLFNFQPDRCAPQNGNPSASTNGNACFEDDGGGYFYGDPTENQQWLDDIAAVRHPDAAYTMLIPQWQSYKSKGSCIIFTDDINIFDNQNSTTRPSRFDHQLQQPLIAERFLAAAMPGSGVCDEAKPADICPGLPASQCELQVAPAGYTGTLAITAGGVNCPAAIWGIKSSGGGAPASVPTTGWPALLGLSALLPLLARRRQRK